MVQMRSVTVPHPCIQCMQILWTSLTCLLQFELLLSLQSEYRNQAVRLEIFSKKHEPHAEKDRKKQGFNKNVYMQVFPFYFSSNF